MQLELFSYCWQCGEGHSAVTTLPWTVYREGNRTSTYYFCGEACRQNFSVEQMRRMEGNLEDV